MKGYIYLDVKVTNKGRYAEYTSLSGPAVVAAGGKYLFAGSPKETLEGSAQDRRSVLVEFESVQKAKEFYNSKEYQAAKAKRNGAADTNMLIFESAASPVVPGWSVESWINFWKAPDPDVARARLPTVVTNDVVAYWPFATRVASGTAEYRDRVLAMLALAPDLKLQMNESATAGNHVFIRWTGKGTGPDGPFECTGVDRVVVRNGLVCENRIYSDHDIFRHLARATGSA